MPTPTERQSDILILGGGIAGLAAAAALARRKFSVSVLEARDRLGGRIHTVRPRGWPAPVELGAEFIHEGNPDLWRRLRKHRVRTHRVPTAHWRFHDGRITRIDVETEIAEVTARIDPARMRRWSFADFLRRAAGDVSLEERQLATEFVEGFQGAPTDEMSAAALEGESLDTSEQFATSEGLDRIVEGLITELPRERVRIELGRVVKKITWRPGQVRVEAGGEIFTARGAVIALPLGVLQAKVGQRGAVTFQPPLRSKRKLIARMQMGQVIRLTLRFEARTWRRLLPAPLRRARNGFGFLHSRMAGVPVWWSLSGKPVITGWAGGPAALALTGRSPSEIRERALNSLSRILEVSPNTLRRAALDFATHNWSRDPFSRGAYSFIAAGAEDASEKLRQPLAETLFFAGEATADGAEVGTIHGALSSGLRAAKEAAQVLR